MPVGDTAGTQEETVLQIDQAQTLVELLVERFGTVTSGTGYALLDDLSVYDDGLAQAYRAFRETTSEELSLSYAAEWLLDNYYIVRQALRQIREDLPRTFYARLPRLTDGPLRGLPRIYAIARALLARQGLLVNLTDMQPILAEFQERRSLTMGELWAFPIFLRYVLIEGLAGALRAFLNSASRGQVVFPLPERAYTLVPLLEAEEIERQAAHESAPTEVTAISTQDAVANSILSLRALSEQDWKTFFETVSRVERILRQDPVGLYAQMDFDTRDHYRKVVEEVSLHSGWDESQTAEAAVALAADVKDQTAGQSAEAEADPSVERRAHVGYYLLGEGRGTLEEMAAYQPEGMERLQRFLRRNATPLYVGSILFIALALLAVLVLQVSPMAADLRYRLLIILLLLVPVLTVATSLVNWLVTLLLPPDRLPKLEFREAVPDAFRAVVVIPALITSEEEVDSLVEQLHMHYMRNPAPGLLFALLADFADAGEETLPGDLALVERAAVAVDVLNQRYPRADGSHPFFFLYRPRQWNASEGKWMGWERKRGKLHDFNRLLLGQDPEHSFGPITGDADLLRGVRYVITLDADTVLPGGAARRLVGTLAHPLNRAVFDGERNEVTAGYTVLQPRMEISPISANRSMFTRIFSGDTGLDLYTLAVSDAYQDLFGEGIYVGKGIYDVAAFERSVEKRIPENRLLSHDLLEGLMGRAALVTDVTMVEDYPPAYFAQALRNHRWIRGDWQLLPWMLAPGRFGEGPSQLRLKVIDRWKIIDNLRRSLLAPSLVALFVLGLLYLPGWTFFWTLLVLFSLAIPVLLTIARAGVQLVSGEPPRSAFRPAAWDIVRWLLAVAFLPYEAYISLDAILSTLYRLLISRHHFLQWTTAAHTARLFEQRHPGRIAWRRMSLTLLLALLLSIWVVLVDPGELPGAAPVLLLWAFSPQIMLWISRPVVYRRSRLDDEQAQYLRRVTRQTWSFFERFVGPEDHWLPPDHFQEHPLGVVAHRTSPTNIGLLLNSTLAAYDLGYIDQLGLAARLAATFETLEHLERYRGHFLNWYDTLNLQTLNPRYVSTVDSGNLAASLIVTARGCAEMPNHQIFRWELWEGYLDTLSLLSESLAEWNKTADQRGTRRVDQVERLVEETRVEILAARDVPGRWYALFQHITGPFWQQLSAILAEMVATSRQTERRPASTGSTRIDLTLLSSLLEFATQAERQHQAVQRTIAELVPWIPLLEIHPELLLREEYVPVMAALREALPYNPRLGQIHACVEAARVHIHALRERITPLVNPVGDSVPVTAAAAAVDSTSVEAGPAPLLTAPALPTPDVARDALAWLDALDSALAQARTASSVLQAGYIRIAEQAETYLREMDFRFLYHAQRRVFHIGFNLDAGQLDNNFYDLLASEARIASLIAIARGEVSQQHWLQMGRPVTQVEGLRVLLSWSATMFEYLMPPLFLRSYPGTLLDESARGAVARQVAYGVERGVPWGISESGFYRLDANQTYQYRAFGVPGLGFKRGLADDLVIAPYASLMAVGYDPQAVYRNMLNLAQHGARGLYGFYEAIDFTRERLNVGEEQALVREYMAHHQGMVMLAMTNFFKENIMVQRMHADPRIQSVEQLLQEQVPLAAPLQSTETGTARGMQHLLPARVEIIPWSVPVLSSTPQVHLLSNGSYSVVISNTGSGRSSWNDLDLTRWQSDRVLDGWGSWIYIQDLDEAGQPGEPWSAAYQPVPGDPSDNQVTFFAHMAVLRRAERGLISTMEITVAPDDPVEIRRVHLNNTTTRPRHLRLTTYGEVILNQQAADTRHPAFNRLFINNEWVPELNLQIFHRRPRAEGDEPAYLGHMLVIEDEQAALTQAHEADRRAFLGRAGDPRRPAALLSPEYLSGSSGATLDPIFALGQVIALDALATGRLACLTFAAATREEILVLARRYRDFALIERTYQQADLSAQAWLGRHNIESQDLRSILQSLSALIYPSSLTRAAAETLLENRLGQPGLWRFGVSGDYPILLVEIDDPRQLDLVREALEVHRYLRARRFLADLVVLNNQRTDYGAQLNGMLYRLVSRVNSEQWLSQRGGIFILYTDQMQPEERTLLRTAARLLLRGEAGALGEQLPDYAVQVPHLPPLSPTHEAATPGAEIALPPLERVFDNGYGGFSLDGREYVIDLPPGRPTPAPWVNVIGYPDFGFLVSEAGSMVTWAVNSGENRLTPWSNDPVRDPTGEVLYLRDEETGRVWSLTPQPSGEPVLYRTRHGAGYTVFEHTSNNLEQRLTVFASPDDPVKILRVQVRNLLGQPRRITATQYVEWVLGTTHATNLPYILPEYAAAQACLLASNPYNVEFRERVAFLGASKAIHGFTADRTEFIGRNGSLQFPAALRRLGLESRVIPGEDPCAVLQIHLDLLADGEEEFYFFLGQGENREHSLALVDKYHDPAQVEAAWQRTGQFWDDLLDTVQVNTPEPALNILLNRWALYQALSCRVWGRTAFYQSSGAFGFRDQLQDVMALSAGSPAIARAQILNAALHQFDAGDVLHWWHPPSGRGVRTRFSDDLLWLPYVTAQYIRASGDVSILQEKVPFRLGPELRPGEEERYGEYALSEDSFTLYEHCLRAIERGATRGTHGLPLMGTGDWNDGMNRVGAEGRGESVWLAWFLIEVLNNFAEICEQRGDAALAAQFRERAAEYAQAVDRSAWDGAWYRRAYYDDGAPLGSAVDMECQIDAIAQSWSVISGAGRPERARQAMGSVLERLVRPEDRLLLLFTPPFDKTPRDPGYIKGYLPGIRENGGQYTHAAIWTVWAFAELGEGDLAGKLFNLLNPIYQADTLEKADVYRVEPYAVCADVYSVEPYLRRGGWTWYTGSAAWMYRLGLEAILGLRREGDRLRVNPVIPPEWDGFQAEYRFGGTMYHISVRNPGHLARGRAQVHLDGKQLDQDSIPLVDDGRQRSVVVVVLPLEG